ncbi:non-canonical purine NTP pyrophosphatase [bacterium]|nr:MAG: non-canonical purine NTP pyrophosphatase [bacterium]
MTILLATTSAHKAREIADLLADSDLTLQTLNDYPATEAPEEDGETMADNARIKAQFYSQHFGCTVLADDSGLEVDALNGEPGVHSARWAEGSDADRVRALLDRLQDVEEDARTARYRCALCLATPDEILLETEGTCEGAIAPLAEGFEGFGYDPIFRITLATGTESELVGQTLGQVPSQVKATVSHRARAVLELAEKMESLGTGQLSQE